MTQIIATTGVLGVGKTTLVRRLAPLLAAVPCLETVAADDFLNEFYDDPQTHALQTETVYLLARYTALKKATAAAPSRILCDFVPFKGLVYGRVTLAGTEQEAFHAIYRSVARLMPEPTLVLDLHASLETVLARIEARDRPGERARVTPEYLARLREAYDEELAASQLPVLAVDTELQDLLDDAALDRLCGRIEECLEVLAAADGDGDPTAPLAASPCDGAGTGT